MTTRPRYSPFLATDFRDRFVITDPDLIYLDGNSLGRLPKATAVRLATVIEQEWGAGLIRSWNTGWFDLPERLGAKLALLLGAQPDEIIVADSTSVNLFKLVVAALQRQASRTKIVTDDLNFPSDIYIMQGALNLLGGERRLQIVSSLDGIHGPVITLAGAVDDDTALLSLSHVTFKSGYAYDMAAVTQLAHDAGALVVWDLSHSAGAVPIDLNGSGADMAVGCTYKYLNGGPGAPAFLYIRRDLREQLTNPLSGWMGQADPFAFTLDYVPTPSLRRFLTGTPTILSLAAIEPGLDLILEAGLAQIRATSMQMTNYLFEAWQTDLEPLGFRFNSPHDPAQRGSHISLGHPESWRINRALIEQMNVLPDFRQPDNIRLGVNPLYNSWADLETAVARLCAVVIDRLFAQYPPEITVVT